VCAPEAVGLGDCRTDLDGQDLQAGLPPEH
jgi:hypothetical protein